MDEQVDRTRANKKEGEKERERILVIFGRLPSLRLIKLFAYYYSAAWLATSLPGAWIKFWIFLNIRHSIQVFGELIE